MSSPRVDDFAIQALVDDELAEDEWARVTLYLAHNPAAMCRYRQLRYERELLARLGAPGGGRRKSNGSPPEHRRRAEQGLKRTRRH